MKRPIEPLRVACWWRRARKADATSQDTPARSSDTPLAGRADGGAVLQVLLLEPVWNPRQGCREGARISYPSSVEAGGIEPPSEGASASASTCVACVLISPCSLPQAGSRAASQRLVSAPVPPALAGAQPEVWRSSPPNGRRQVERCGLIRQPVRSFRLQLSSPARIAG